MPVSFLDPRSPVVEAVDSYRSLITRPVPTAPRIGLLANGFPDSPAFLTALAGHVTARLGDCSFAAVTKLSPPTPLTSSELQLLTEECDAVIAAYGH